MRGVEGWLPLDIRIRQWSGAPSLLTCRCASGLRGPPGPLRLMCRLLGGVMGSELPSEGFSLGSQLRGTWGTATSSAWSGVQCLARGFGGCLCTRVGP